MSDSLAFCTAAISDPPRFGCRTDPKDMLRTSATDFCRVFNGRTTVAEPVVAEVSELVKPSLLVALCFLAQPDNRLLIATCPVSTDDPSNMHAVVRQPYHLIVKVIISVIKPIWHF